MIAGGYDQYQAVVYMRLTTLRQYSQT